MIKTGVYGDINSDSGIILENILDVAEFDVVGMYSTEKKTADEVSSKLNIKNFEEKNTLINNVDAVIAISPVTNLDDIKSLVKSSKHVFFEPTSAYCNTDVNYLSSIVDEANVKVQPGFHHRFNNTFLSAKPFIVSPRFIISGNFKKFSPKTEYCSVLMDMIINDVDIVLSVVKSNVKNIYANASAIKSKKPDIINVRIEFYNGCVAQLTAGKIAIEDSHKMAFYCRDNYTNIDILENKAMLVKKKSEEIESNFFQETIGDLYVEPIVIKPNNVYYDEFSSFAKSIIYNKSPEVNIDTILKTYEVVKRIKEKITLTF